MDKYLQNPLINKRGHPSESYLNFCDFNILNKYIKDPKKFIFIYNKLKK